MRITVDETYLGDLYSFLDKIAAYDDGELTSAGDVSLGRETATSGGTSDADSSGGQITEKGLRRFYRTAARWASESSFFDTNIESEASMNDFLEDHTAPHPSRPTEKRQEDTDPSSKSMAKAFMRRIGTPDNMEP